MSYIYFYKLHLTMLRGSVPKATTWGIKTCILSGETIFIN